MSRKEVADKKESKDSEGRSSAGSETKRSGSVLKQEEVGATNEMKDTKKDEGDASDKETAKPMRKLDGLLKDLYPSVFAQLKPELNQNINLDALTAQSHVRVTIHCETCQVCWQTLVRNLTKDDPSGCLNCQKEKLRLLKDKFPSKVIRSEVAPNVMDDKAPAFSPTEGATSSAGSETSGRTTMPLATVHPNFSISEINLAKVSSLNEAASAVLMYGGLCPYCQTKMDNPAFGCPCQKEKGRLRTLNAAINESK